MLTWNEPAIGFYLRLGAVPMDGWQVYRLAGDALDPSRAIIGRTPGQNVQKSRSQTDTQPIRVREGRKGSGVMRRPVSLLIDSPDPTALFDRTGRVLLANDAALAEGTPGPGNLDAAPGSSPPFWLTPPGRDSLIEATASPGERRTSRCGSRPGPRRASACSG